MRRMGLIGRMRVDWVNEMSLAPAMQRKDSDARLLHGILFVLLMGGTAFVPAFRGWPWIWLVPLVGYFVLVGAVRRLRSSFQWLRLGRVNGVSITVTGGLVVLTSFLLVASYYIGKPDMAIYRDMLPVREIGSVVVAGVIFSLLNAVLEELVFRGVLFDALTSQWGGLVALIGSSVLFGLGHMHGYPPGPIGAGLAGLFGFAVGVLRMRTGGLGLPIVAHVAADATIYSIFVAAGVFLE